MPDRVDMADDWVEGAVIRMPALFKNILEIAADAVISVDESQHIVVFNRGAERIFGYQAAEIMGRSLDVLIPEGFRSGHSRHVSGFARQPVSARQMGERGQIYGQRKNGEVFPADASISRVSEGGKTLFTAILRDVTQTREAELSIKRLNAELNHHNAQLENAYRELESFSYSVSHDLRAPLRSIDGFSQLLLEDYAGKLDDEGRNALERIRANSQRMAQLIDDILNLSRLTRGEVNRIPVDLGAMARTIAEDLTRLAPERQVEWVIGGDLRAEADPHLMRAAMTNLLGNAWKFTSKRDLARIEVGSYRDDGAKVERGTKVFFVRDNGAGFDMAYVDKLFGPFQRLHAMQEFPGSGVGLATVQRVVHKHGGFTWAEGAVDQGATLYFSLG